MYKIFPLMVLHVTRIYLSDHRKNLNQDNWVLAGQKYEYFQGRAYIAFECTMRTRGRNVDKVQQNDILYHVIESFSISLFLYLIIAR